MNNKLFRILVLFISVCITAVTTLLAVSFGLSNSGLSNKNDELTNENENLTDEKDKLTDENQELNKIVGNLQDTLENLDEYAAVATYIVDGAVWRIQIVQKDKEFELPELEDTATQEFRGWQKNGEGAPIETSIINDHTEFVAYMVNKNFIANTWYGLNNFNGDNVWTDGTDYYYSAGNIHFKKDPATNAWNQVNWSGLDEFDGKYVWNYNGKTYYTFTEFSSASGQNVITPKNYVLNKDNNTWVDTGWSEELLGSCIFFIDGVCYYSHTAAPFGSPKKFNGETWEDASNINILGYDVWTDGVNVYGNAPSSTGSRIYNRNTETWDVITWRTLGSSNTINGSRVWTDGTNLYYSDGTVNAVIDTKNRILLEQTWVGTPDGLDGQYIWTDGENIYYSKGTEQYIIKTATNA